LLLKLLKINNMYYIITTKYGQIKETEYTKALYCAIRYKGIIQLSNGSGVKTFINNFSDTSNER